VTIVHSQIWGTKLLDPIAFHDSICRICSSLGCRKPRASWSQQQIGRKESNRGTLKTNVKIAEIGDSLSYPFLEIFGKSQEIPFNNHIVQHKSWAWDWNHGGQSPPKRAWKCKMTYSKMMFTSWMRISSCKMVSATNNAGDRNHPLIARVPKSYAVQPAFDRQQVPRSSSLSSLYPIFSSFHLSDGT